NVKVDVILAWRASRWERHTGPSGKPSRLLHFEHIDTAHCHCIRCEVIASTDIMQDCRPLQERDMYTSDHDRRWFPWVDNRPDKPPARPKRDEHVLPRRVALTFTNKCCRTKNLIFAHGIDGAQAAGIA